MKKIIQIVAFVFAAYLCNGQNIVQENKMWSNTHIGSEIGSSYKSDYIKFSGDTTINQLKYKKVLKSEDAEHSTWSLHAYIREDSVTQKVYLYKSHLGYEEMLYDFSLKQGDSINYLNHNQLWDYVVVDTIYYCKVGNSPIERKHIVFTYLGIRSGTWIEGIGSNCGILAGIFYLLAPTGGDDRMVCYFENNELILHNSYYKTCFPQGTENSIEELKQGANKYLEVYYENGQPFFALTKPEVISNNSLQLYRPNGTKVFETNLKPNQKLTVPNNKLAPGMYIYYYRSKIGEVQTGKVVVK